MDETPLHKAMTPEEVERLLNTSWTVDVPGWMETTPLHQAAQRGLPEVARSLILRGANVNARRPDRRDTSLHFAFSPDGGSLVLFETSANDHDARPKGWRGDVVF